MNYYKYYYYMMAKYELLLQSKYEQICGYFFKYFKLYNNQAFVINVLWNLSVSSTLNCTGTKNLNA